MSDPLTALITRAMSRGVPVPPQAAHSVRKSLAEFGDTLDQRTKQEFLDRFLDGLKSIVQPVQVQRPGEELTVTEGDTPATLRGDLTELLSRMENPQAIIEDMNLDFKVDVAINVMRGGARALAQNYDQDELDEFPALELLRVYDRDVPRGFKRGPKGTLIPVPNDAWDDSDGRWVNACRSAGDDAALRVFQETGRMVALKSSGVWQALGDGAGGYDDTLGNPYPPFAFNSGHDVDGVPRAEAEQLGLIQPGAKAQRADIDFEKLFAFDA
jgi:hypothetical protein